MPHLDRKLVAIAVALLALGPRQLLADTTEDDRERGAATHARDRSAAFMGCRHFALRAAAGNDVRK